MSLFDRISDARAQKRRSLEEGEKSLCEAGGHTVIESYRFYDTTYYPSGASNIQMVRYHCRHCGFEGDAPAENFSNGMIVYDGEES